METLRIEVQELMERELKRANEKFPLFNSTHEGISVIREELLEAYEEVDSLTNITKDLEQAVFKDKPAKELHSIARQGVIAAICGACELIQCAAMFDKFRTSMDQKKAEQEKESEFMKAPQEKINKMADRMLGEEEIAEVRRRHLLLTKNQMEKAIKILEKAEERI